MKILVIALGGNALGNNPEEQLELVKQTAKTIAKYLHIYFLLKIIKMVLVCR